MQARKKKDYKALYEQTLEASQASLQRENQLLQINAVLEEQVSTLTSHVSVLNTILDDERTIKQSMQTEISGLKETLHVKDRIEHQQAERISQLDEITASQNTIIAAHEKTITSQKKELVKFEMLKHEFRSLRKWAYGRRSEKMHNDAASASLTDEAKNAEQLKLLLDFEVTGAFENIQDVKKINAHLRVVKKSKEKVAHMGRHDLPDLEEEITRVDVDNPPAGAIVLRIERQVQLAVEPMRWYKKVTERVVYIVPNAKIEGKHKSLIAPQLPHPIPRCKVDISVLVMMAVEKYIYHDPVWRQRQRMLQSEVDIKYNTLNNLLNRTADLLEPIYDLHLKDIIRSGLVQADETTWRVLDSTKNKKGKKSHIGYMWGFANPMLELVVFVYKKGRGKKDVHDILKDFKGHLITDAYGVYTSYGKKSTVTHSKCLSHARRYFANALLSGSNAKLAAHVLETFIQPLYALEELCKLNDLCFDEITDLRQNKAVPLLDEFYKWLQEQYLKVTPRTPLYKAIVYTLNNFKEIRNYTLDGMLPIDNNFIERAIRPIAMGRKNHMFSGSHEGGKRAAIMYSLLNTCKMLNINPSVWLTDVLQRIGTQPVEKLKELLPQYWKPAAELVIPGGIIVQRPTLQAKAS